MKIPFFVNIKLLAKKGEAIMLKRWCLTAFLLMLAGLLMKPAAVAAESARSFRQQNGLQAYAPPHWFLEGYFIAREKKPTYVFGPVKDFVRTIRFSTLRQAAG